MRHLQKGRARLSRKEKFQLGGIAVAIILIMLIVMLIAATSK